jgi:predicted site-specific integrase-resolvase
MSSRKVTVFELNVTGPAVEPGAPSLLAKFNKVRATVSHNETRKRYYVDVWAIESNNGFERMILMDEKSHAWAALEPTKRFSEKRLQQLAEEAKKSDDVIRMIARILSSCNLELAAEHADIQERLLELTPR